MTVWRVAIDENGGHSSYSEFKKRGVVAIGWRDLGNFTGFIGLPRATLENYAQAKGDMVYATTLNHQDDTWWFGAPPQYAGHRSHIGRIFDYFINQIEPGDLVLAHVGMSVVGIAELGNSSGYFYDSNYEYANCRPVKWVDFDSTVSECRFLGICKLGSDESNKVVYDWSQYKQKSGFVPPLNP